MQKSISLKDWILATRPWSFAVSALPALVAFVYCLYAFPGAACAAWPWGVLAIVGAVIFHSGGNLISDYYDFKWGVDAEGNVGATTILSGQFSSQQILRYGWACIAVGTALGLFLVWKTGLGLLWIGLFGAIGTVCYSLLKARALGDLLILLLFGPTIMMGTAFVMLGHFAWIFVPISLPVALITVCVLHSNNTRDTRSDRRAGLHTVAFLLGVRGSIVYYITLTTLTYALTVAMVALRVLPCWALLTLVTLPVALRNCRMMARATADDLSPINMLDKGTAQLQLLFSLTLTISILIPILI